MFVTKKYPGRRFESIKELNELETLNAAVKKQAKTLKKILRKAIVVDILPTTDKNEDGETQEEKQLAQESCSQDRETSSAS